MVIITVYSGFVSTAARISKRIGKRYYSIKYQIKFKSISLKLILVGILHNYRNK